MAPKAKRAAKAKATPAVAVRPQRVGRPTTKVLRKASRGRALQLRCANARQLMRKDAVRSMNALATELGLEKVHVHLKGLLAGEVKVERLVRALETRCQTTSLSRRLLHAVRLWSDNGGTLPQPISGTATGGDEADEPGVSPLPRHRVLEPGYTLKSKAFMLTFNSDAFDRGTWAGFERWVKVKHKEFGSRAWAACIEESLHAAATPRGTRFHLHCYFFWTDGVGLFRRNLDDLVFEDVRPRVDKCNAQKKVTPRTAACHGLWYVTVKKLGTVESSTNYKPGVAYKVLRVWLDGLYDDGKLSHAQYMEFSRQFPRGHAARKRDCEEVLREEHQAAVSKLIKEELEELKAAGFWKAPRQFAEVDLFLEAHVGLARDRRPIFAIIGGTQTGNSLLAASVLEKLAAHKLLSGYLEVTVEDDGHFDMSDFRVDQHAGVLLDGVGDTQVLHKARETLQGRPKPIKGGRSATMVYAYTYTLCRRAVVATFDLSAQNLHLFKYDHWLRDPRNVIQLHLTGPAWDTGVAATGPPMSRAEQMRSWTVAEAARFLQGHDLEGPAQSMRLSGVNGADLLGLSLEELSSGIRLTPFAARKVIAARNAFLDA